MLRRRGAWHGDVKAVCVPSIVTLATAIRAKCVLIAVKWHACYDYSGLCVIRCEPSRALRPFGRNARYTLRTDTVVTLFQAECSLHAANCHACYDDEGELPVTRRVLSRLLRLFRRNARNTLRTVTLVTAMKVECPLEATN